MTEDRAILLDKMSDVAPAVEIPVQKPNLDLPLVFFMTITIGFLLGNFAMRFYLN